MKRGVLLSIGLLVVIYINGCGINGQGVDPGLENDPGTRFQAHDHREGFGLWNQQGDRKNPIANIVTRDERPGRGMNGILDRTPPEMNQRISRFDAQQGMSNKPNAFAIDAQSERNIEEQITLELLQLDTVRDAQVISQGKQLLIAVDCETNDTEGLKSEIETFVTNKYPNKNIVVVTDRHAVDRIRLLDDGFIDDQTDDRDFIDNTTGPIAGQSRLE
ncbi:YhcN/YlaJ family sporulation lipoprotein [Anaerobacillus sp. CMMVII]|uniref:YhcN/YlaJ family sporulation lipoprotein n=1 Tax=Anaerobacillus sp. CMMVII TaxID=2755588 RepID=UPI0021B7409F|nr:YhcN/YlaJ family sporulation lipoprotein [Anaerobacillus sp. CMMVII]MCT8137929.1 YhcN/YlaJ family sporulation lipoprotein [Anaerobacillus sp. CMMVII]